MMNRQRTWAKALVVACVLLGLLLTVGGLVLANSYAISPQTVAGGGSTSGTGGNYALSGSVGQHGASSQGSGGSYTLTGGFWNPTSSGGPTVVTLARFIARSARGGNGFVLPLALVALGAAGGIVLLLRKRRG
jgi:hypothetical protein